MSVRENGTYWVAGGGEQSWAKDDQEGHPGRDVGPAARYAAVAGPAAGLVLREEPSR